MTLGVYQSMYKIRIYKDPQGNQPIKAYLTELAGKTDKDSRIKLNKIDYYLQALRNYGTRAGEPFVKHIKGEIWELRPLQDRFFFFSWQGDNFILLHHFEKKTPLKEIEQAERIHKDFIKRSGNDEK